MELSETAYRYAAISVALVIGGALVVWGYLDGSTWASLAGGVLTGGTGVAVVRSK